MNTNRRKRLFGTVRRRRLRFLHLAAAIALLSACTPRTEAWSTAESPKRNVVNWVEYRHVVAFPGGSTEIAPADRASLDGFLGRIAEGEGVRVTVAADKDGGDAVAMRREAAVSAYLRQRGIRPQLGAMEANAPADAVRVTVGRYVVTPPNCPDWTKPAGVDTANTVSSNFGCATTANLGLMVADPGALVRGYPTGLGDGDTLAKGIQNYRKNSWQTSPEEPWKPISSTGSTQ